MVTDHECWDAFWDRAAEAAVQQARRRELVGEQAPEVRRDIERHMVRLDRAMRELRAALRASPEVMSDTAIFPEWHQMNRAAKSVTVAHRRLKSKWQELQPGFPD